MAKFPFILGTDKLGVNIDDPWVEIAIDGLSISDSRTIGASLQRIDTIGAISKRVLQVAIVRLDTINGSETAIKDISIVRLANIGGSEKPNKDVTKTFLDELNSVDIVAKDVLITRTDVLDVAEVLSKFISLIRQDRLFATQFIRYFDFVFDPERLFVKVDKTIYYLANVDTLPPIVVDVKDNVIFQNYKPTEVRFKLYDEAGNLIFDKISYYSEESRLLTYIFDAPLPKGTYYGRFVVSFETGDVMTIPSYGDGIIIFVG